MKLYLIHTAEVLRLTVEPEEYVEKLVEYCNMKLYALASVEDTKQTWAAEDDFQVVVPGLKITVRAFLEVTTIC